MGTLKYITTLSLLVTINLAVAQTWSPVGAGVSDGYVYSLCHDDSMLYAGGTFTNPVKNIAQWNGATWQAMGSGINGQVNTVFANAGKVYAGGWFSNAGGRAASCAAWWNGSNWSPMGAGVDNGVVTCIDTFENYVCLSNTGSLGVTVWNGTNMLNTIAPPQLSAMANYNGDLYAVGYQVIPSIYYQYGNADYGELYQLSNLANYWTGLVSFPDDFGSGNANSLAVYNSNLYIGGSFDTAGAIAANNVAMWNGTAITTLGSGVNGPVNAMVEYNGLLYVGGNFDSAGGQPANNIATWDGSNWSALGQGVNSAVLTMTVFKGDLYIGGSFTDQGNHVAKYNTPINDGPVFTNITIYPNPNYGVFTIGIPAAQANSIVNIYDYLGQKIYSTKLEPAGTKISLYGCSAGVYLYRVIPSSGGKIATGKFIIL